MKFLKEHAIEPNGKITYAQLLHRNIYPYIGAGWLRSAGRRSTAC